MDENVLASLSAAAEAAPGDLGLRLHLAECLAETDPGRALTQVSVVLAAEPGRADALALLSRLTQQLLADRSDWPDPIRRRFNWAAAEEQVADLVPLSDEQDRDEDGYRGTDSDRNHTALRLADVGGMADVKLRLEAAFLAPLRNPALRTMYAKSLRGGLLLYGPPGCGKTFLARALAGELGAAFHAVSLADVLDMYLGQSERNLREVFQRVRRQAPCVLFLDEVDALGQKRSQLGSSALRGTVNQLLTELDDVDDSNEGVFVLAATNAPWDVDPALRRPGRLDRAVLVLPPDRAAREQILRFHLRGRPLAGVDVTRLAKDTGGFSGADLAQVCDRAAELALLDVARTGVVRMIDQRDLRAALTQVRQSTGAWFQSARTVVMFSNDGGEYDELLSYMKAQKIW